ncbi:MAG: BTAD domain-containing putative transcriptional regulator [Acidimicrobiia bacterium]|nr:BTAD domain-containing putative transcriptional regulator [Acidimicrobiia bacterium]
MVTSSTSVSRLDALRFEQRVAEGRRHLRDRDHDWAAACFADALALWRGAAFEDAVEVVPAHARWLESLRRDVEGDLAAAEIGRGRHAELVPTLEALVDAEPLRERRAGLLMLALYRCSRQRDALDVYQRTRRRLVDELGVEPGRELRDLEQAILRQDPALDDVARSRDLPTTRPSLPRPPDLVGRDAERREVLDRLDVARLVTVTGPPGVGKSALAVDVAREVAERVSARRVCYLDLTTAGTARSVTPALLDALGVAAPPSTDPVDEGAGPLEGALLVLDGYDRVAEGWRRC